jgi:hypothetical protein
LTLINDILDLSKIESGTTTLNVTQVDFRDLRGDIERTFRQVAQQKALDFRIELDPELPRAIATDNTRLQQVLKNLLSNGFKFTDRGGVTLQIAPVTSGWSRGVDSLNRARSVIAFSVADTGIGIPAEKQAIVFEPFQQADMETSRRYGGTGLGLSISREIAQLLGGEIELRSEVGRGSTFTLYLPVQYEPPRGGGGAPYDFVRRRASDTAPRATNGASALAEPPARAIETATRAPELPVEPASVPIPASTVDDDRDSIGPEDRVVLIVEDDESFARVLLETARERGFKGLVATQGDVGLAMARKFVPDAITLDIQVPELDGWKILDLLKHDPSTRHVPVHIISVEEPRQRALESGALAHLRKPPTKEALAEAFDRLIGLATRKRNLLVVEDDETQRKAIVELIGNGDVLTTTVGSGAEALEALRARQYDCVVLDLGLPDMNGFELIEKIKEVGASTPIIVYTGKELTRREETRLRKLAETIIVKDAKSPERLLDETALFLHRVEAKLPEPKRRMLEAVHRTDPVLEGKQVLIVDDDMRNIFALTSALERYKLNVSYAENGRDALESIEQNSDLDVVLMDIMMPEMDGYETIRRIRENPKLRSLPIIALTAKAMKGDREKCIEAGASDYITKPVDVEQLLSLLRVWLYR